jgi:1L-myo-inositol 1-phosphate cytidylyltransferase
MTPRLRPGAVVLAAGNGARLSGASPLPKPLVEVGGRPLLDHVLGGLAACDVSKVAVVVGHQADRIRQAPFKSWTGAPITWIENRDFERPNGMSLLAASEWTDEPFALLMSDHLFETRTLAGLLGQHCPEQGGILATDSNTSAVFDADDATRVVTRDGRVERVGKILERHDAIDTGMFLLSRAVFDAMRESARNGDESLSGGINRLAARGMMRAWDIGTAHWIDVDTPEAWAEAERLVARGVVGIAPAHVGRGSLG